MALHHCSHTFAPPDVSSFVAAFARRAGASLIVSLGGHAVSEYGDDAPPVFGFGRIPEGDPPRSGQNWKSWDFQTPISPRLPEADLANAVVVSYDPLRSEMGAERVLDDLAEIARRTLTSVIAAPSQTIDRLAGGLEDRGLAPTFRGLTRSTDAENSNRDAGVLIVENPAYGLSSMRHQTPDDFKVVAFVITYNEIDIIRPSLEDLFAQGVEAYVIDNWSTDGTYEAIQEYLGRGVVGFERSPVDGPPQYFDLRSLLRRVEELIPEIDADWLIKHDVDEARRSPWAGVGIRDALYRVQTAGYNCVDFTVVNFRPTDNDFEDGSDFVDYFRHFEFGLNPGHFRQFKAWRSYGQPIEYASFGSHRVKFTGFRVFPYKFLLRHYPVRSQAHGERKVFRERKDRFLPEAKKRGWHTQYDALESGHSFLHDLDDLYDYDRGPFEVTYLLERLSGAGLVPIAPQGRASSSTRGAAIRERIQRRVSRLWSARDRDVR